MWQKTDRQTDRQTYRLTTANTAIIAARAVKIGPLFQFNCCLKHILEQERSETGTERAKNLVSGSRAVSGCEKKLAGAGAERDREVAERETVRGSGVTEIGLSGERKFCRSSSAHMLCRFDHTLAQYHYLLTC